MPDLIRFEERWIKPYGLPLSATDLTDGEVYFIFHYLNTDLIVPKMETVVFIGRNLDEGDVDQVYFQDIRSFRKGIRYDSEGRQTVFSMSKDETKDVFEYEGALNGVLRCELRRRVPEKSTSTTFPSSEGESIDPATLSPNDPRLPAVSDFSEFSDLNEYLEAHPEFKEKNALSLFIRDMGPSRFEERELNPESEPAGVANLAEGEIYFLVEYVDDERLIPVLDTLVYLGRNLKAGDAGKVYFQDAFSYNDEVRYGEDDNPEWASFYIKTEDELNNVFEFEPALEELMRCSLRRRKP